MDQDQRELEPNQPTMIVGPHMDDLLGIAPTEKDLDRAKKAIEQRVQEGMAIQDP